MTQEHLHFVTGRLAHRSLERVVEEISKHEGFAYSIDVLPITVAALMTPSWIARHIRVPGACSKVIIPGYSQGDLQPITDAAAGKPVVRGPNDLGRLPEFFGHPATSADYGKHNIEILAEINHAPQLSLDAILAEANRLAVDGADVIDVGCDPSSEWAGVAECVTALRDSGHRVSIDSFQPAEVEAAVHAGAELVLSVNRSNRDAARDWGCSVVAIPDDPQHLDGLEDTIEFLDQHRVPHRIDPILEPIGCGFTQSLARYMEVRRRYPAAEMLMGIGNLTELTDVDSAGINVLLLAVCQELGIQSVLTTQVINWARTSVKECDLARRLVFHSVAHGIPPKHLAPALVLLRDAVVLEGTLDLDRMADQIKDNNYRIFVESGHIHALAAGVHLQDTDPFRLFDRLTDGCSADIDTAHAFYLGFEMAKAATALILGKQYEQDESLDWGYLTVPERWHRVRRGKS
jgi:dihydropteroate synthase-like protein